MFGATLQLALVFNATIFNYRELRTELIALGYAFFSDGDSEVILKAHHAWGEQCVHGMFAFANWNMRGGRNGHSASLFLARDRFGIKPLYLTQIGNLLRFASSLPGLLAGGGVDTRLDPVALHHHSMLHTAVPAPRRSAACRESQQAASGNAVEQAFGHDRACRVLGADEQNVVDLFSHEVRLGGWAGG